jgi:hypothetical protein
MTVGSRTNECFAAAIVCSSIYVDWSMAIIDEGDTGWVIESGSHGDG